jgi:predicted TIM-barrel fold metal-dependent hydrolase
VKEKPSSYVRRNVRATTAPAQLDGASRRQVRELVEIIGADWLLFASDYPRDHGPSGPRLLEALDDRARDAILGGNAMSFYAFNDRTSA